MLVYGTAYLVVILSPMEFSFVIPVEGKSTPDIHAALSHVLTKCGKRNHTIPEKPKHFLKIEYQLLSVVGAKAATFPSKR